MPEFDVLSGLKQVVKISDVQLSTQSSVLSGELNLIENRLSVSCSINLRGKQIYVMTCLYVIAQCCTAEVLSRAVVTDMGLELFCDNDPEKDLSELRTEIERKVYELLLSRENLAEVLLEIMDRYGVKARRDWLIYVDGQGCNLDAYSRIMSELSFRLGFSRTVIRQRLIGFRWLRDVSCGDYALNYF